MEDKILVSLIGLDAFTMLQTLKLMFYILLFAMIISLSFLLPVYIAMPDEYTQAFFSLSIMTLPEKSPFFWFPFVVCVLVSLVSYYLIVVYYRNYVLLRQAFVRNPAAVTSLLEVVKVTRVIKESGKMEDKEASDKELLEQSYGILNVPAKAVFVTDLPSYIMSDQELFAYGERLNVGKLRDAVLVKDTAAIRSLQDRKQSIIALFEHAVLKFMMNVNKESKKKDSKLQDVMNIDDKFDILKEAMKREADDSRSINLSEASLSDENKKILDLLKDINFLSPYRPKISRRIEGTKTKVDEITFYLKELEEIDGQIKFQRDLSEKSVELNARQTFERFTLEAQDFYETYHRSVDNITFISLKEMYRFSKNLEIARGSKAGFLLFDEIVSANILRQSLVDSSLFSCNVRAAPQSQDLLWENLNFSHFTRAIRESVGGLITFLFSVLFFLAVMALSSVLSLSSLQKIIPGLQNLNQYPILLGIISGILAPLALNLMLMIAPIVLYYIAKFQGKVSESATQLSTMSKYNWFLLVNAFLAFLFSRLIIEVIVSAVEGDWGTLVADFGESITKQSVFFINFIIQKTLVDMSLLLLKPVSLIIQIILKWFRKNKTPRDLAQSRLPPSVNYGSYYPEMTVVFPIAIAYTCVSPLTVIVGCAFFAIAFFATRHEFIFTLKTAFESGGQHWFRNYRFIMVSLLVFQIATAVVISLRKAFVQSSLLIIMIAITIILIFYIEKVFRKRAEYLPLNVEEEIYINSFTKEFEQRQKEWIMGWEEERQEEREESIPYQAIVGGDSRVKRESADVKAVTHAYRDPVLFSSALVVMLPDFYFPFFKLILERMKDSDMYNV